MAKIFRITRERVRQIEFKATRKLQHPLRTERLAELLGMKDEKEIFEELR